MNEPEVSKIHFHLTAFIRTLQPFKNCQHFPTYFLSLLRLVPTRRDALGNRHTQRRLRCWKSAYYVPMAS